jgi:hypothetical protein
MTDLVATVATLAVGALGMYMTKASSPKSQKVRGGAARDQFSTIEDVAQYQANQDGEEEGVDQELLKMRHRMNELGVATGYMDLGREGTNHKGVEYMSRAYMNLELPRERGKALYAALAPADGLLATCGPNVPNRFLFEKTDKTTNYTDNLHYMGAWFAPDNADEEFTGDELFPEVPLDAASVQSIVQNGCVRLLVFDMVWGRKSHAFEEVIQILESWYEDSPVGKPYIQDTCAICLENIDCLADAGPNPPCRRLECGDAIMPHRIVAASVDADAPPLVACTTDELVETLTDLIDDGHPDVGIILSCGHAFHPTCLKNHVQSGTNKCPICIRPIIARESISVPNLD